MAMPMRTRDELRAAFAATDDPDYLVWLKKQPEGDRGSGNTSRGLGDTFAKVTSAIGIKPCGGCKERQEKLNKLIPYTR